MFTDKCMFVYVLIDYALVFFTMRSYFVIHFW